MRPKISIIGAGNVGRSIASWCAMKELGNIVLWNRSKGKAMGNAFDLLEAGPIVGYDVDILGTDNLRDTKNSDIIVFTAGFPRKPGMIREELIDVNYKIVYPLIKKLSRLSRRAIIIMVTNPLDVMSYTALKASRFPRNRVIGMAGILDSTRFKSFIADELNVSMEDISTLVLGSHGENMVSLPRLTTVGGIRLEELMNKKRIDLLVKHTQKAGAEIVNLLKANASFSVGASATRIVESIIKDKKEILPCSAYLKGEYGLKDVYLGVPCIIGSNGIERIIELKLNNKEKTQLKAAGKRIKEMINSLN